VDLLIWWKVGGVVKSLEGGRKIWSRGRGGTEKEGQVVERKRHCGGKSYTKKKARGETPFEGRASLFREERNRRAEGVKKQHREGGFGEPLKQNTIIPSACGKGTKKNPRLKGVETRPPPSRESDLQGSRMKKRISAGNSVYWNRTVGKYRHSKKISMESRRTL